MRQWDYDRLVSLSQIATQALTEFEETHSENAAGAAPWIEMLLMVDQAFSACNTIRALIRREKQTRA